MGILSLEDLFGLQLVGDLNELLTMIGGTHNGIALIDFPFNTTQTLHVSFALRSLRTSQYRDKRLSLSQIMKNITLSTLPQSLKFSAHAVVTYILIHRYETLKSGNKITVFVECVHRSTLCALRRIFLIIKPGL